MLDVYRRVAHRVGSHESLALANELSAWHDAMVSHQRTLARLGLSADACTQTDDCAHGLARELWQQAREILGEHANDLTFLRDCAAQCPADRHLT